MAIGTIAATAPTERTRSPRSLSVSRIGSRREQAEFTDEVQKRVPRKRGRWRCALALLAAALSFPSIAAAENAAAGSAVHRLGTPENGSRTLRLISPDTLEIAVVEAGSEKVPPDKTPPPPPPPEFAARDFKVEVGGKTHAVSAVGFRRRPIYAPLKRRDLRIGNFVYLRLETAVPNGATVSIAYSGNSPLLRDARLSVVADPRRHSPAIHVNQHGYAPDAPKQARVGTFLGTLGELPLREEQPFEVVEVRSGEIAHRGSLTLLSERGLPQPAYRRVGLADFSALTQPGEYRLVVSGLGASFPFVIHEGVPAAFARVYALGFYHQRCGAANALPFTRFGHEACHLAPAEIPAGRVRTLPGWDEIGAEADVFPFVAKGEVDVAGGHHDAGDYSKYTINSAGMIHHLVFAADAFAGAAELDNLGLPESGDGKSDLLQLARWEADFLAKLQDKDGGFYFLVYPRARRYEQDVLPDRGDPQLVWPKNTAATAAAVAALAQCASSPRFQEEHPEAAKRYLAAARRGWEFLTGAGEKFDEGGAYRKFTHYGDEFKDADEITWAACELFLATGEREFDRVVQQRLRPRDPETRKWGWKRLTESYGRAIRSYAFGAKSGRVPSTKLQRQLLLQCEEELIACADDMLRWAREHTYGTSFPEPTKRVLGGGWYFPLDQAFDLATACNLDFPAMRDPRRQFREAVWSNLNYEAGTNPVGVSFVTGLGWKRPLEIVHQYAQNDRRALPPSGITLGSIQDGFGWTQNYKGELGALCFPLDGAKPAPYPLYDRWGDAFNLQTEFVVVNQARALATTAWLMAQSALKDQPWRAAEARIVGIPETAAVNRPVTLRLEAEGLDLASARIVWEAEGHEPLIAREFVFTPKRSGAHWIEAEAYLPDGRRVFAVAEVAVR